MKQVISDIINVVTSINQIDLLLYISILVLIILIVSLIYIIKNEEDESLILENANVQEPVEDLKTIANNLENSVPIVSAFTEYEKEQEERAIISYEELLAKSKMGKINYEEENVVNNEISIKKINVDSLMEKPKEIHVHKNIVFCNYKREEEFLDTLKSLNKILS